MDESAAKLVPAGALLVALYGATVGRIATLGIDAATNQAVCHIVPRDSTVDRRFLFYALRTCIPGWLSRRVGGTQPNINQQIIKETEIPLPPLAEQRRIAEVLDRAEALRATRRPRPTRLPHPIPLPRPFRGPPATNPKGWSMVTLENVLSTPLRNGLSPSKSGKVHANVLTLSAITGNRFDATAWKTSTFMTRPPVNQSVSELDFLICRGNGNVHMVGKGYFPCEAMPEMTFPDTMIAARISTERIERAFLQHVRNSCAVRKQVEAVARTTNGTFKVNQPSLEGILFVSPPIKLQREFARRVTAVDTLKTAHRASLAELDALFSTLQHRAFRGEL